MQNIEAAASCKGHLISFGGWDGVEVVQMPKLRGRIRCILIGAKIQDIEEEEQVAEREKVKDGDKVIQSGDVSCVILCQKKR